MPDVTCKLAVRIDTGICAEAIDLFLFFSIQEEEENSEIEDDELDLLKENLNTDDSSKIGISKVKSLGWGYSRWTWGWTTDN